VVSGDMHVAELPGKAVLQVKRPPETHASLAALRRLEILLGQRLQDAAAVQTDEPEKEVPKSNAGTGASDESEYNQLISELDWPEENLSLLSRALELGIAERRRRLLSEATDQPDTSGGSASQLASLQSKLTSTRKALKDREWTLAEARQRQQQLEDERARQDCRIRSLERALERSTSSRSDAEQRHLEECLSADAEAAEQRGELRRRLSSAEMERDKALEDLVAAEQRAEESRQLSERREEELQAQLAEAIRENNELRQRGTKAEEVERRSPREADEIEEEPVEKPAEVAPAGSLRDRGPRVPPVDFSSLQSTEAHLEGVGMVMSTPRRAGPLAPRGSPPKTEASGRRSTGSAPSAKAAANLPMNLRSLGKLLSGGGVLGK